MSFKPQKVLHLKDELSKKNPKLHGEFLITEKIDGWYVYFEYLNGRWHSPRSSAGRVIPAFSWLDNVQLPKPKGDAVLIAEAYLPDTTFQITNGIFNRSTGDCLCKEAIFACHDLILLSSSSVPAIERYKELEKFISLTNYFSFKLNKPLEIAAYDNDLWLRTFDKVVEKGGEGIVAKRTSSLYLPGKRNSDLLKLKLECTVDLLAVRLEEGIGEKGNPSLTLVSRRKNGVEVRTVISKHSDQIRFRTTQEAVIGKVVEVKAMEELQDGQLKQAVFVRVREDKTEKTEID